jgi:hypothetical protein
MREIQHFAFFVVWMGLPFETTQATKNAQLRAGIFQGTET